ncbi:adenosylcobinamide-GDP ribazoletransferase [Amycolatopsis arida]|uniref:Adenosylcobinamide-GDP ribazoletransferase n=1 Tax=Amycolatopsis arida TaxID=587909 RepID=A0A1I5LMB1_9PSEU|nr:adenosylcobinamide-GDP ribazoletransferase [Amycolatopsis arida]TDX93756.1 adenosylcobinamide-GDP ribazoletransferase [Amycolatopsis arida]SFO97911.1 adenosylcobinamide-GDP ribazoletransferase [Amycolatopsis arida]
MTLLGDAGRLAVGTLTALPVPPPRTVDARVAGAAMLLAPIAAVPLAAVAGLVVAGGAAAGLPALATAGLAVGAVALATRGLHLDGLADTADGLAVAARPGADVAAALAVMRRGDTGPAGVTALVLVVLVQCAALAGAVAAGHGPAAAVVAVLVGRGVLAGCCVRGVPAARPGGLGAAVAGTVPIAAAVAAGALLAAATALVPGLPWWRGPVAVLAGLVAGGVLLARCVRRLGGTTGDVLGACVEAATTTALLALAP